MILYPTTFCREHRWPGRLPALAGLTAVLLLALATSEAQAGLMLPDELAAASTGGSCLASDSNDDASPNRDSEPLQVVPTLADQHASHGSGASGTGTTLTSGGPTSAVFLSASAVVGSLEPTGACLERANAALPIPPSFDFLRPPCRLA